MGRLQKVNFGKIDAEKDQYMLQKAFIITPHISKCHNPEISLIIGRKGAGKSAVVEHLLNHHGKDYDYIVVFKPTDLRFSNLKNLYDLNLQYKDIDPIALMEYVWRTVLLAKVMQSIISHKNYTPVKDEPMYQFVTDHFGVDKSFFGKFIETAQKCLKDSKGVAKYAYNLASICGGSDFEKSYSNAIESFKKHLNSGKTVLLLIDNVDEHWSGSEAGYDFIHALVHAVRHLSSKTYNNLFVKCFVPTDIAKGLKTRHSDKVHEAQHELLWSRNDLLSLVGSRIAISLNIKGSGGGFSKDYNYCWGHIFEERGSNLIGRVENSFDYIIRHTLYRPRDLLRACKYLRNKAVENGIADKIPFKLITEYLPSFCEDSIDYLEDEYRSRLDQLLDVIAAFNGFSNIMDYETFLETVKGAIISNKLDISERDMEKLLYEIGFIGGMRLTYPSRKDPKLFKTQKYNFKFSFNKLRFNLKTAQKVCIHPMFYELLSVVPDSQIIVQGH